MANKILNTRFMQKNDTSENWAKATNFTPLNGEIIVYTDLGKIKIGDGITKVGNLDFANAKDAETLMGASLSTVLNDSEVEIPTSKAVLDAVNSINIPTKTSELTNDSGYLTEHQSLDNYYTKPEVDVKIPTKLDQLTDNVGYVKTSDLDSVAFDGYVTKGKKSGTTVGANSTAEGLNTQATKNACHAEGSETQAIGDYAHAEGAAAVASGTGSHAEGQGTYANGDYQHAQGKYNEKDIINKYANIVGNGTSDSKRSNAHTIDWDGNGWFAGKVSVGTLLDVPNPLYANDLVTKKYVDNKFATKSVSLAADSWTGTESPYSQVVTLSNVTPNSKVDLQPTPTQLASLADNETILNTANDNGTVTVYAIGNKPTEDYTMQATITEV